MSSSTLTLEETLATLVRDVLAATPRPVPAGVPIVAAMDVEPVERPFVVAIAGEGETIHPEVRRLSLVLRVRSQIDATTTAQAAHLLMDAAGALIARGVQLTAALAAAGLQIMVWRPGEFGSEQEDERGRFQDLTWAVTLRSIPAIPLPDDPASTIYVSPDGEAYTFEGDVYLIPA